MKEYSYDRRPSGRTEKEQAKKNAENLDEFVADVQKLARRGAEYLKGQKILREATKDGKVAFVAEERPKHPLVFNSDLSEVSYGDVTVNLKPSSFEGTLLRLLVENAERGGDWVSNETVEKAMTDDYPDYDGGFEGVNNITVKNARTRLNNKFKRAFGLDDVIQSRRPKTGEGGGGRSRLRLKCERKK